MNETIVSPIAVATRRRPPHHIRSPPFPLRHSYYTSDVRGSGREARYASDFPSDPCTYEVWMHVHRDITDVVRRMPVSLHQVQFNPRGAAALRLLSDFIPLSSSVPEE